MAEVELAGERIESSIRSAADARHGVAANISRRPAMLGVNF